MEQAKIEISLPSRTPFFGMSQPNHNILLQRCVHRLLTILKDDDDEDDRKAKKKYVYFLFILFLYLYFCSI